MEMQKHWTYAKQGFTLPDTPTTMIVVEKVARGQYFTYVTVAGVEKVGSRRESNNEAGAYRNAEQLWQSEGGR